MDIDATLIDPALAGSSPSPQQPNDHSSARAHGQSKMPHDQNHSHDNYDDDDDPVVATFNILLKPTLPANRRVLILEHPNKSDGRKPARAPMELRVKPATGMVEVDFPIDYNTAYDRTKGLNWGTNLHKNIEAKKGGSHGLAGGFGVGAPPPRAARAGGRGGAAGAHDDEIFDMGMDWSEALRKDYVLRTQTLGGQTPDVSAESKYMVGVFTGSNLHLTPASSLVHLRPQLHHIDATAEQERLARGGPAGGAGGAGAAGGNKEAARAIHMTIKQSKDGSDELVQETMADRLKRVQTETWRRMRYVHDEAMDSWAVSEEALYLRGPAASSISAGKQPEGAEGADADASNPYGLAELAEQVAALRTAMDEDGMLEKTSGIVKAKPAAVKMEISDDEPSTSAAAAASTKARTNKGKAAVAPAARRGKKAPPITTTATTTTATNDLNSVNNNTAVNGTTDTRASTSTGQ